MKTEEDFKTTFARLKAGWAELRGEKQSKRERAPFVIRRKPRKGRRRK